jgi:sugar/nucleoside kinase (ribokinase family)
MTDQIVFVGGAMTDETYDISQTQYKLINKRLAEGFKIPLYDHVNDKAHDALAGVLNELKIEKLSAQPGGSVYNTMCAVKAILGHKNKDEFATQHVVTSQGHGFDLTIAGETEGVHIKFLAAHKPQNKIDLDDMKKRLATAKVIFMPRSTFTDRPEVAEAVLDFLKESNPKAKVIATFHGFKPAHQTEKVMGLMRRCDAWIGNDAELGIKELAKDLAAFAKDEAHIAAVTRGEKGVELFSEKYHGSFVSEAANPLVSSSGAGNAAEAALAVFMGRSMDEARGSEKVANMRWLATLIRSAGAEACTFKTPVMSPDHNKGIWGKFDRYVLKEWRKAPAAKASHSGLNP